MSKYQKYRLIQIETNQARKIRFGDPTYVVGDGPQKWNAGLLFRPTEEHFDIDLEFNRLPKGAVPVEISSDFVLELINRRIPQHPLKQTALDATTITGSKEVVERARKSGLLPENAIVLGLRVNDQEIAVSYPEKSNLSNLSARISDGRLLNELNAYAHGIVEALTEQARANLIEGSDALLEALNRVLPIADNYLNSQLAELKDQVEELRQQLLDRKLSRDGARRYLSFLSEGFVKGIGAAAGKKAFEQAWPLLEPKMTKIIEWLLMLIGLL